MSKYTINEPAVRALITDMEPEAEQEYLSVYKGIVDLLEMAWMAGKQKVPLENAVSIVRRKRPGEL